MKKAIGASESENLEFSQNLIEKAQERIHAVAIELGVSDDAVIDGAISVISSS